MSWIALYLYLTGVFTVWVLSYEADETQSWKYWAKCLVWPVIIPYAVFLYAKGDNPWETK